MAVVDADSGAEDDAVAVVVDAEVEEDWVGWAVDFRYSRKAA